MVGLTAIAQPTISNESLTEGVNTITYDFAAETDVDAIVYLSYELQGSGDVQFTNLTNLGTSHEITLIGIQQGATYNVTAHAFNADGSSSVQLNSITTTVNSFVYGFDGEVIDGPITDGTYVMMVTKRFISQEPVVTIYDNEGNLIWYKQMPYQTNNVDCSGYNLVEGKFIYTDCHNIYIQSLGGEIEEQYTVSDEIYLHGKPIINQDGNIVVMNAHRIFIDLSLIGGSDMTNTVSDGILEIERGTGDILWDWRPFDHLNYFITIDEDGGKWSPVFGNDAKHWRIATGVVQDMDGSYLLTYTQTIIGNGGPNGQTTHGVAKINRFNNAELFIISEESDQMVVYPENRFIAPRQFRVLDNGNYFMVSNTIAADSTRISRFFLEFGYMGYYIMLWTVDQCWLPQDANTNFGSALILPNENCLGFSETTDMLYDLDSISIAGSIQMPEDMEIIETTENIYYQGPDEVNEVFITGSDDVICNNNMETVTFELIPEGGFIDSDLVTGNTFNADGLSAGEYTFVYQYGFLSDSVTVTVDNCVGLNELIEMGGINSKIYPNPVSGDAVIRYEIMEGGDATIEIFDLQGRLIEMMDLGYQAIGLNMIPYNAADYQEGVYTYRITSSGMTQQKRFVVAH